jgi:hypothetical protein
MALWPNGSCGWQKQLQKGLCALQKSCMFWCVFSSFVSRPKVFLKDTLEAAQNDQELQLLNQLKKKARSLKRSRPVALGRANLKV